MHKNFSRHFLLCLTSCLLAANSLSADPLHHAEEVEVGTKELSQEAIDKARELELIAPSEDPQFANEEETISLNDWQQAWNNEPTATKYYITDFETTQNLVRLTDGSQWKISPSDTSIMKYWQANQGISIEVENTSWVTATHAQEPYFYFLRNATNGQSIRVLLYKGSNINSPLYRQVITLSIAARQFSLNDGSTWRVSHQDLPLFEEWAISDTIIIGSVRKGWFNFFNPFPHVIINVDSNHFVRTERI